MNFHKKADLPYYLILGSIMIIGFVLRFAYYDSDAIHPDEPITLAVVEYLQIPGTWDTNWNLTNVREEFNYDQYNFSAYFYAAYLFHSVFEKLPGLGGFLEENEDLHVYRLFSVLLSSIVLVQAWRLSLKIGDRMLSIYATGLISVTPILIQDAHYARPEPLTTVLVLAAISLVWPSTKVSIKKLFLAAILIGLLIAIKISMIALIWLPLVTILLASYPSQKDRVKALSYASVIILTGAFLGFLIGAPGAIIDPEAYINGVQYLQSQYANLHPPHGHSDGGMVGDMLTGYFWTTLGTFAMLAGMVGTGRAIYKKQNATLLLIVLPVVLFAGYFMTRSVFFERNLSHVVPLFCILSGLGVTTCIQWIATKWPRYAISASTLAGCLIILTPFKISSTLTFVDFSGRSKARIIQQLDEIQKAYPDVTLSVKTMFARDMLAVGRDHFEKSNTPFIMAVSTFEDEWSPLFLENLENNFHMTLIGQVPSNYENIPTCTLHTYNSTSISYYHVSGLKL
jgi:hypothetical protein